MGYQIDPGARVLRHFETNHLPDGEPRAVADLMATLAHELYHRLPNDPETTTALRKLLEAKDAAVRAALEGEQP